MKASERRRKISLKGQEAKEAHEAFERQIREWGLVMPNVDPLILDFGLGDFEKTGLIECLIANEFEHGYCGKYLFVFDGQTMPMHRHEEKVETFSIVKGRLSMTYDGKTFEMNPGDVLKVEKMKYHSLRGLGPALLLEVSMPCSGEDNDFEDSRIPVGRSAAGNHTCGH